jgi:TolB-like protein
MDTAHHQLKVADIVREIEPQVFDLLAYLVVRGHNVVSRDELIEAVWKGRIVSDSAIGVRINAVRKAVGDNGVDQAVIKTVPRRGYKLAVPVTVIEANSNLATIREEQDPVIENPKPVIAVFPFDLPGASDSETYISRGIADDIATELSRFHSIAVLSTFSTFQYNPADVDSSPFAKDLGATHLVSGSIQRRENTSRLTVRLVELEACTCVWSERYTIADEDLFDAQDDAVASIVGRLFSRLEDYQIASARMKPTVSLKAYDCLLRALDIYKHGDVSLEASGQALYWFNRTLELDPDSARALAWRICCASDFQPNPPTLEFNEQTRQDMRRALAIDPGDHEVHRIVGALNIALRDFDLADYHLAKSAELNPNDARILLRIGFYRSFLCDHKNDLNYVERAFDRNPLHPNFYWNDRGIVLFAHERHEEAVNCLQLAGDEIEQTGIYRAACLEALGERNEARSVIDALRRRYSDLTLNRIRISHPYKHYKNIDSTDRLVDLLGAAGLPH